MQQKRFIHMVVLGAVIAILGIVTFQYMLAFVILAVIVAALFVKEWVESLVEKIVTCNRSDPSESARLTESVASVQAEIHCIEDRVGALERRREHE